ncbi:hypothetical protein GP486_003005 [Trichoglossum hirsutum]|uniref:Uncharacterized protein n=1 Tax=Trichoglossum hirsutum TaxID=265104 RepID=A0A9P8LDW0_9PEZI|nr:hypothetical protein GP486_003005 [Trichoglossum hirsutum]
MSTSTTPHLYSTGSGGDHRLESAMAIHHPQTDTAPHTSLLGRVEPATLPVAAEGRTLDRGLTLDLAERDRQDANGVTAGITDPERHLGESGMATRQKCLNERDGHVTNGLTAGFSEQKIDSTPKPDSAREGEYQGCGIEERPSDPAHCGGDEPTRRESPPPHSTACINDEDALPEGQQLRPPLADCMDGVADTTHGSTNAAGEISKLQEIESEPDLADESINTLTTPQVVVSTTGGEVDQPPTSAGETNDYLLPPDIAGANAAELPHQPRGPRAQLYPPSQEEAAATLVALRNATSETEQSEGTIINQPLWVGPAGEQESGLRLWEPKPGLDRDPVPRVSSTAGEMPHYAADVRVFIGARLIGKLEQIQRLGSQTLQTRVQLAEKRRGLRYHRSALRDSEADFMSALSRAWAMGDIPWSLHLTSLYEKVEQNRNVLGPLEEAYDEFEDQMDQQDYKLRKLEEQYHAAMKELLEHASGSAGIIVRTEDPENSEGGSSDDSETRQLDPLEYSYLSTVGEANIVKERMSNLDITYEHIQLEADVRKRHNIELSKEFSDFLDTYQLERAKLEEEASALDEAATQLRQKCIDNGIIEQGQQPQQRQQQGQLSEPIYTPATPKASSDEPAGSPQHLAKYGLRYGELRYGALIAGFTNTRDRVNRWLLDVLRSSPIEFSRYRSFQIGPALEDIHLDKLFSALFEQCWLNDSAATGDRLSPINTPTGTQESLAPNSAHDRKSNDNTRSNNNKNGNGNKNTSSNNGGNTTTHYRQLTTPDAHPRTTGRDRPEDPKGVSYGTPLPLPMEPELSPRSLGDSAALTRGLGDIFSNSYISIEETESMRNGGDQSSSYLTTMHSDPSLADWDHVGYTYQENPSAPNPYAAATPPRWSTGSPPGQSLYCGDCHFLPNDNLAPLSSPKSTKTC